MPALTWNSRHDNPHVPYDLAMFPTHHPIPQPPQIPHNIWILDCKACGAFLTNRGMKAVLLLRPNVSLFSTDALPVNCSVYSSSPEVLRPPLCTRTLYTRTCECLTQTMCCHHCGSAVGYMIVLPCGRCTSSITASNRATNGHRFVFHSSELTATERHYIQDEPGVIPYDIPFPMPLPPPEVVFAAAHAQPLIPSTQPPPPDYHVMPHLQPTDVRPASTAFTVPRLPSQGLPPPHPIVPSQNVFTLEHKDLPPLRRLRPGDVLYWHNLARSGEIPGVEDDIRARSKFNAFTIYDR